MSGIKRLFGTNFTGITPLGKVDKPEKAENISFKSDTKPVHTAKKLSTDTLVGLKQLSNGIITEAMADDLLATPYVSLDFNG